MSKNDITGDRLISKANTKAYDESYDRIFYSCLPNCKYLIDTLTKCKLCPYKTAWDEKRVDIVGSNGNDGEVYHWLHKHGHRPRNGSSPTYKTWSSMLRRVRNKNNANYGGIGITVDEKWHDFLNFLADMGERPAGCTIDRIDVNKGYFKENCRWANNKLQCRNKRASIIVTINEETMNLIDFAIKYNIPNTTIYRRYHKGLSGIDLIKEPVHGFKKGLHYE